MSKTVIVPNDFSRSLGLMLLNEIRQETCENVDFSAIKKLKLLVSFSKLEQIYTLIVKELSAQNRRAMIQTHHEIRFRRFMARATNTRLYTSVWIGKSNFDFFLPYIAGEMNGDRRMRGLVIEIDGGIHNFEPKMKKDTLKAEMLLSLGIGTLSLDNNSIYTLNVRRLLRTIKNAPKIDFRASKRLWTNIYAYTILTNKDILMKNSNLIENLYETR